MTYKIEDYHYLKELIPDLKEYRTTYGQQFIGTKDIKNIESYKIQRSCGCCDDAAYIVKLYTDFESSQVYYHKHFRIATVEIIYKDKIEDVYYENFSDFECTYSGEDDDYFTIESISIEKDFKNNMKLEGFSNEMINSIYFEIEKKILKSEEEMLEVDVVNSFYK